MGRMISRYLNIKKRSIDALISDLFLYSPFVQDLCAVVLEKLFVGALWKSLGIKRMKKSKNELFSAEKNGKTSDSFFTSKTINSITER